VIGGDDVSNDVITLGTCFSIFVYIRARFHFALIGGNLTAQSTGEPQGNWRWNSNSRDVVASAPSFPVICKLIKRNGGIMSGRTNRR